MKLFDLARCENVSVHTTLCLFSVSGESLGVTHWDAPLFGKYSGAKVHSFMITAMTRPGAVATEMTVYLEG